VGIVIPIRAQRLRVGRFDDRHRLRAEPQHFLHLTRAEHASLQQQWENQEQLERPNHNAKQYLNLAGVSTEGAIQERKAV
jgi:hypothetical protein